MKIGHAISLATLELVLISSLLMASAQTTAQDQGAKHTARSVRVSTGLITERIPARLLPKWQAIEKLALGEDAKGQPLHPTLRNLWEWAESSGHAIYIELIGQTRLSSGTAGQFSLERLDPTGERDEAVIRLYLANIDQAFIGESVARADGFIPFKGLKKEARYAEVLGHELAHAVDILADPAKVRKVEDLVEQTNELLLAHHPRRGGEILSSELKQRLAHRDILLRVLEDRAAEIEAVVWRELSLSSLSRSRPAEALASARP